VRRRLVRVAALAALLVPAVAWAAPADELKALRGRIETLRKQLSQSEESRSEAADALRESERAISDTNRRLFELAGQQQGVRAELARLDAQRQDLERHVERQRSLLARQLYQRYLAGQPEPLQLMLDRRDPADLARQMHYLGYVYRARARAIDQLRLDVARLHGLAQQTVERGRELSGLQAEQVQQRRQLEMQKRDRAEVLAKVSDEVQQQRRQIDRLKADEQRLTRLVEQLAKTLAAKKRAARAAKAKKSSRKAAALRNEAVPQASESGTFRQMKGRMRLPVAGELGSRFGSPRADGGVSWKGLFIRAKPGEEVRAVAPGRVVFADWLRGFGNLVIVDHDAGYMSLYANNEAVYRQVGDSVRTGDPIASVGSSGGSPETGLYFELRYLGKPFDPLGWVSLTQKTGGASN
jgi:septal ring factor EnvC (AmiA/AmiB activator)